METFRIFSKKVHIYHYETVILPESKTSMSVDTAEFHLSFFVGVQFGTTITYPLSGWLCASGFAGGWPSVFYVFGNF